MIALEDATVQAIAQQFDCPTEPVSVDEMLKLTAAQLDGVGRIAEFRRSMAERAAKIHQAVTMRNEQIREMKG